MPIVSTNLKIYSDSSLRNLVKTVNGSTSETQTLTFNGLRENTQYWAQAEATNSGGVTGKSVAQTFTTLYNEPTLSITTSNVTHTTATVNFLYTGNMPVDPTAMSAEIKAVGAQTGQSVQFDYLSAGTPMPVNLTGLTPSTTYSVSWDVDYYDGEVSKFATFTTSARPAPTVAITGVNNVTPISADIELLITT